LSIVKAKYIDAGGYYAQTLWLKQQLGDFGVNLKNIHLLCDNTSAINLTKNLILHSHIEHIEIRHHFIREYKSNGNCEIKFVGTIR